MRVWCSEARNTNLAGLYRLIVEVLDPSNGADSVRIRLRTTEDLRAPVCHDTVADLVAYAHEAHAWTLDVSLDEIRSTARGAVARERLHADANGERVSPCTRPWADGTTGIK